MHLPAPKNAVFRGPHPPQLASPITNRVFFNTLLGQLAEGGVLVAPVGPEGGAQTLLQLRKTGANISQRELGSVWFVPMVPAAQ